MRIVVKFPGNVYNLMRRFGYHPHERAFVRRIGVSDYPRFHIYPKVARQALEINLHLDQKKPIYKGATAHSGESKGELVEREAERIKQISMGT